MYTNRSEGIPNEGIYEYKDLIVKNNDNFSHYLVPDNKWKMTPVGDFYALTFNLPCAPNAFHRFMQKVILGIKWERINK